MVIKRDAKFYGVPASRVKKLLGRREWTTPEAMRVFDLAERETSKALTGLAEDGVVEFDKTAAYVDRWKPTELGTRIAAARIGAPIKRSKAESLLAQTIENARVVNADKDWPYVVKSVTLFGSMLTDKEAVGDVDTALDLTPRFGHGTLEQEAAETRVRGDRVFSNSFEGYGYAKKMTKSRVKASPLVSTHNLGEVRDIRAPHQTVYRFDPDADRELDADQKPTVPKDYEGAPEFDGKREVKLSRACRKPAKPPETELPTRVTRGDFYGAALHADGIAGLNASRTWQPEVAHMHANGADVATIRKIVGRGPTQSDEEVRRAIRFLSSEDVRQKTVARREPPVTRGRSQPELS